MSTTIAERLKSSTADVTAATKILLGTRHFFARSRTRKAVYRVVWVAHQLATAADALHAFIEAGHSLWSAENMLKWALESEKAAQTKFAEECKRESMTLEQRESMYGNLTDAADAVDRWRADAATSEASFLLAARALQDIVGRMGSP